MHYRLPVWTACTCFNGSCLQGTLENQANLTAYDPDNFDTIEFLVSSATDPVPVAVIPVVVDQHRFSSIWNVTYAQPPGALQLSIRLRDAGGY